MADDWRSLGTLDPRAGHLGAQLRCLELIRADLPDTPIIQTIFNPLAQAKNLAGTGLVPMLRAYPREVTGLRRLPPRRSNSSASRGTRVSTACSSRCSTPARS
jgi:hypothetical protein